MFRLNPIFRILFLYHLRESKIVANARYNVDTCQSTIDAILGKDRLFDAVNEPKHATLTVQANSDSEVEEKRSDLDRQRREHAKHTRRWVLIPLLVVCFLIEAVSCVQVFAQQGFENPDRTIFGLGLAVIIFVLIAAIAHFANKAPKASTEVPS